jgi:hypothetical protein
MKRCGQQATVLKDNGVLIYYNTVWQPLSVRLNETAEIGENDIQDHSAVSAAFGVNVCFS